MVPLVLNKSSITKRPAEAVGVEETGLAAPGPWSDSKERDTNHRLTKTKVTSGTHTIGEETRDRIF